MAEPQLCSTAVIPIRAPRRLGSAAIVSVVSAAAFRMQRDRLAQPRGFGGLLEQPAELTRGQRLMMTGTWKQPALFWREGGIIIRGRPYLPPLPKQLQDLCRWHHGAVLAALRLHDADDLLLTVDVARPQPHHFTRPQPATIG